MFQNYTFAVIDFSKNNPYPPTSEFLKKVQMSTGIDASRLVVIARNNQRVELQPAVGGVRHMEWIDDSAFYQLSLAVPVVKHEVASIIQTAPQEPILVTSYSGAVLGEIQRLGYPNVDVQSLASFKLGFGHLPPRTILTSQFLVDATPFTLLTPPRTRPHWRFDGFISLREAQTLMLRALHRRGAVDRCHAVSMPNLKPAMAELDRRFVGSGQTNGTSGMIGVLAMCAHSDGMLEAAASYNGTPYYWVTTLALQQLMAPATADLASTANVAALETRESATATTTATPPESFNPHVERPGDTTAVIRRVRERSPHKSQRMQDALIESGSGPRTKQRVVMLEHIGEILSQLKEHTLTEILDLARDAAVLAAPDGPDKQAAVAAFGSVRKMLREFLPASKALKDANKHPLPVGFRAGPTPVASFDADWRMRTEAQLLLRLITVFPEPVDAEHDVENIVGALYHVRTGPERRALKRQVEAMIGYLLDEGLIHEELSNGHQILVPGRPKTNQESADGSQLRIAQSG